MSAHAPTQNVPPAFVVTTASGSLGNDSSTERLARYMRQLGQSLERPAASGSVETAGASETLARFSRLNDTFRHLLEGPESDEFGPARPTIESIEVARKVLFRLVERGFKLPEAVDVATDHDGDLRIVWENGPRFLELVVPYEHAAAPYFYYSHGDQYNLQRDLSLSGLRERFNWLGSAA